MKIGIIGGSGFIGSHTVERMIQNKMDVTVLDIQQPIINVKYIYLDILDHRSCLEKIKDFTVVYHFAAISDSNDNKRDPAVAVATNIQGLTNVLDSCVKNNIQRFIFSSSVWVYSATDEIHVDESTSLDINKVNHVYTATKLAGEALIRSFTNLYGLNHTILRYGIAYGPGQNAPTAVVTFIQNAMNCKPIVIHGDGSYHRNFMYVTDHANGNIRALNASAINETINLEGPEPVSIKRVAHAVTSQFNDSIDIIYKSSRTGDYTGKIVSNKKAYKLINWSPKVTFEDGIKNYTSNLER